jgi:hypothetical protein
LILKLSIKVSASKPAKSAAKASQPSSKPQTHKEKTRSGRERRPSDKVAAQRKFILYSSLNIKNFLIVLKQQEANLLKAQKAERRALRKKKALQKANQLAEFTSDDEGEYEARNSPTVCFC